jgi:hypothetical protein
MIDVSVRLLANWAAVATHGVNDIAATIPRKNLNSAQDDEAPPSVAFFADSDDEGTAEELDPPEVPALVFWGDADASVQRKGGLNVIAKQVRFAAGYVTDSSADALTAIRNCGYILRAGRISFMSRFNSLTLSKDYRELNGVRILSIDEVNEHRVTVAVGKRKMWGFLEIKATVIDTLS